MTYRSRSGGPQKTHRKGKNAKKVPKLHHPPAGGVGDAVGESASESAEDSSSGSRFNTLEDEEILAVMRDALQGTLDAPDFRTKVQTAKGLLYERKWLELFTDEGLLEAYAGRWGPSRALCFRDLMGRLAEVRGVFVGEGEDSDEEEDGEGQEDSGEQEVHDEQEDSNEQEDEQQDTSPPPTHILSLGGGAGSELLAVAALAASSPHRRALHWTGADIGSWSSVLQKLDTAVQAKWDIPTTFTFVKGDILATPSPIFTPPPDLTTLFFTLAELFAQSREGTLALLRRLTDATTPGALLLVADSASDIAELPLGKDGRTWPIYMVLDVALKQGWERIRAEDSCWFRLGELGPVGRNWPAKLENCRYWYRLYRRV